MFHHAEILSEKFVVVVMVVVVLVRTRKMTLYDGVRFANVFDGKGCCLLMFSLLRHDHQQNFRQLFQYPPPPSPP